MKKMAQSSPRIIEIAGKQLQFEINPEILRQNYRICEDNCCICLEENQNTHGSNNLLCPHICICTTCAITNKDHLPKQCPICKTDGEIIPKKQRTVVERIMEYAAEVKREQARSDEVMKHVDTLKPLKVFIEQCFGCPFNDKSITDHFNLPVEAVDRILSLIKILNHQFEVKTIDFKTNTSSWTTVYLPQNIVSTIFPTISKIGFFENCFTSEVFFRFEEQVSFTSNNPEKKISQHELLYLLRNIGPNKITFPVLVDINRSTPEQMPIDELLIPTLKRFSITQTFDTTKYKKVFVTFLKGYLYWSSYSPINMKTLETEAKQIISSSDGAYVADEYVRSIFKNESK